MRTILQKCVQYQWKKITILHILLWPLSWIFICIVFSRKKILLQRQKRIKAPLIVVGNVSVGGNGKTPFVIALANNLTARGLKVGIISRGYGRTYPQTTLLINHKMPTEFIGDEAQLIWKKTTALICVSRNRIKGAQILVESGCQVIISDDGLQHYGLYRDIEVGLISMENGIGNGLRIPAGPLRESKKRLLACDFLVLQNNKRRPKLTTQWQAILAQYGSSQTKDPYTSRPHKPVYMHYKIKKFRALCTGEECDPAHWILAKSIKAVCAIANPERFATLLAEAGFSVELEPLPDHDRIKHEHLQHQTSPVFITEKDAVKLENYREKLKNVWVVEIAVSFSVDIFTNIANRIAKNSSEQLTTS